MRLSVRSLSLFLHAHNSNRNKSKEAESEECTDEDGGSSGVCDRVSEGGDGRWLTVSNEM